LRYPADENEIEASEHLIAEFLVDFATRAEIEKTHIIAHSMGNRGLLRALQRITATARESGVKFGQIILAAPDIDCDTFRNLAHVYERISERTTLYISNRDNAVGLSRLFHDYDRVGRSPPVTVVSGIDTIEVPNFDLFDVLGHTYFAEAEAMLHDIYDLLRDDQPPVNRQRLVQAQTSDNGTYWVMER
jgi:esterase/lipase superfamily enzyme